jgi:Adenylate and Guanylate cyclase catalytic domain
LFWKEAKKSLNVSTLTLSFQHDYIQETSDLALRIGLNSGPTTAGVLRGEKARFQLFGDVSYKESLYVWQIITGSFFTLKLVRLI